MADTVSPIGLRVSPSGVVDSAQVPPGAVIFLAGPSLPAGYVYCNGQAISRITFADLFAEIGTDYGAGDGVTTFNVPDLNNTDRFPRGATAANRGTTGGSSSHDHAVPDAAVTGTADVAGSVDGVTGTPSGGGIFDNNGGGSTSNAALFPHTHTFHDDFTASGTIAGTADNGNTDTKDHIPPFMRLRAAIKT